MELLSESNEILDAKLLCKWKSFAVLWYGWILVNGVIWYDLEPWSKSIRERQEASAAQEGIINPCHSTCCWAQQQKKINDVLFTESLLAKKYENRESLDLSILRLQFLVKKITYICPSSRTRAHGLLYLGASLRRGVSGIMICHVQCQKEAKQTRTQRQPWSWINLKSPWTPKESCLTGTVEWSQITAGWDEVRKVKPGGKEYRDYLAQKLGWRKGKEETELMIPVFLRSRTAAYRYGTEGAEKAIKAADNLDRNWLNFLKRCPGSTKMLRTCLVPRSAGRALLLPPVETGSFVDGAESQISQGEAGLKPWLWEAAEHGQQTWGQAPEWVRQ